MTPHKPSLTPARPRALGALLALALAVAACLVAAPAGAESSTEARHRDRTFYSASPALVAGDAKSDAPQTSAKPKPPPTKGVVTGQVVSRNGTPVPNALVTGLRFSDFGLPVDLSEEARVVARTDAAGRFTLDQLTEPYLIRVCSEAGKSKECATEPDAKHFTPAYRGPDGTTDSWLRQTRLFQPRTPRRAVGTIRVEPVAVLEGRFKAGANRTVYLFRGNGSIAEQTFTDEDGGYRFEVAAGTYRLEADRHEGLRTDSTVPGFRSDKLHLRAGRRTELSFRTRHAATVRGLVTAGGKPVADQFIAILDTAGRFAAGVVTNPQGRYVVSSLKPGTYTLRTSASFSAYEAAVTTVTLEQKKAKTVDLALSQGSTLRFSASDVGGTGVIDAELRNADGRVVKVYQGEPASEPGSRVTLQGLTAGTYQLYLRRITEIGDGPEQTAFPWASRTVTLAANATQDLGVIPLDQPTLNLSGTLPTGSQVKITAVPEDPWLRASHIDGDQGTPMALNWTEAAAADGSYVVRGIVPGTYTVAVTTALRDRGNEPSTVGANVATTHHTVTVSPSNATASFTAPVGAKVKGKLRYASNHRPLIAPVGYQVNDEGADSWLFPTVSGPQRYGRGFRVLRLHEGNATGTLLDLEAMYAEHPDTLFPDTLVSSSRLFERGTPYWFAAKPRKLTLEAGQAVDIGFVDVRLKGR